MKILMLQSISLKRLISRTKLNSIKVLLDAYRDESANIRVLYKIFNDDSDIDATPYNLFPGYNNIDDLGNVIDVANNNGLSNYFVTPSASRNEFKEYDFFIDDLPEFTGFQLKIVMTGTNQNHPSLEVSALLP